MQADRPQYPNLDQVSFLILDIQFFYCVENGKAVGKITWPDAYKLPEHDKRFILADCHLIVNWRRVTKIDYKNRHIYIDDVPVWFDILSSELVRQLINIRHAVIDKEAGTITYSPPPVHVPPSYQNPIQKIWSWLCGKT